MSRRRDRNNTPEYAAARLNDMRRLGEFRYKQRLYYPTGKTGVNRGTGREAAECENFDDAGDRVWFDILNGIVYEE